MLTCREFAHRHASDYIDGQLGWRARLGVRFHLLLCDNCRRFIAQLRKVRSLARGKPVPNTDADLSAQDNQALGEQLADIYLQQKDAQQKNSSPPL